MSIASFPTPGQQYKVKQGDWISRIADMAYGDAQKWPEIKAANPTLVKSGPDGNGVIQEFFLPGNVIFIPELPERQPSEPKKLNNKSKDDMTIIVDDIEIPLINKRIIRTMDTVADQWTGSFPWTPGEDLKIDEITRPFAYKKAEAFINGELLITGILYNTKHIKNNVGVSKDLEGFSYTADIVDSNMDSPYEKNNVTLIQRAEQLLKPFGIKTILDENADIGGQFKRVTANPEDKIFDHLLDLAKQRGVLLSSTIQGNLFITVANLDSEPVGTIKEDETVSQSFEMVFNGRARFNIYKSLSNTPRKSANFATAQDNVVPRPRLLTFKSDDSNSAEIKNAAIWKKNKTLAEDLTIPFPVTSWYDPRGNLWRENTLVTVVSPTIEIKKGFTFLIRQVEYIEDNSGRTAVLGLVPPEVYSKNDLVEPWLE